MSPYSGCYKIRMAIDRLEPHKEPPQLQKPERNNNLTPPTTTISIGPLAAGTWPRLQRAFYDDFAPRKSSLNVWTSRHASVGTVEVPDPNT